MRLGILGGTFDPVHRGHLTLARAARDEAALDEVLFVVAGQPWRKERREISGRDHRLAMLQIALEGEGAFRVATLELDRPGPSYTADTLEALAAERIGDGLFFVLGEDALVDMPNWVRPRRILELATMLVARRAEVLAGALDEAEERLPGLLGRCVWLKMPQVAISATQIRERARRGLPIGDLVPDAVEAYIRERGLYRRQGRAQIT